jgi:thiol-disulfide isomerase/thioredoxin
MLLKCLSLPYYEAFYQYYSYHFCSRYYFRSGSKSLCAEYTYENWSFSPKFNNEPKEASTAAYTMQLKDEKGASISLEDLKGKVVFINFWATWCSPCIAEIPTIQSLYEISKMMMRLSFYSGSRWQSGKKLKNYLMTKDLLFLYHSPMDIPRSFTKELYLLQ